MKNSIKRHFVAALLIPFLSTPVYADVTPYPDPPNAEKSSLFSLSIDEIPVTVMDYMDYQYAHFAFDGSIRVTVSTAHPITDYTISPLCLGIEAEIDNSTNLTFTLNQAPDTNSTPRYLVLQINSMEKLVLLGDPPETDEPASTGPGIFNVVSEYGADNSGATYTQPAIQEAVNAASNYGTSERPGTVFVPPGLYKVRADLLLKDNVDFYLAPGAVLEADADIANYTVIDETINPVIVVDDAENVTIRGRGEVNANGVALMDLLNQTPPVFLTQSDEHPRRRIIRTCNTGTSGNVNINGILFKDATGWSVELKRTLGVAVQNVKVLNHKDINRKIQNDGINICSSSDARINQCFVMTIDDAVCAKATDAEMATMDNVQFLNSVLWNWAAGVKCGMQNNHPMNGVIFRNMDIIHCRRALAVDTKTSQDLGQSIPIENILFEQIRTEEIEGHWSISNHDAIEFILEDAPANNIMIRNFTCPENRPLRCGPNYSPNGVTFENFIMDATPISNASQVTLEGTQPINNLTFSIARPSVSLSAPTAHTNTAFKVTATFTEPVSGLKASDVVITNGAVSALSGGPTAYTLTITPTAPDWISILLPDGAAQNSTQSGNFVSALHKVPLFMPPAPLPEPDSGSLYLHLTADRLRLEDGAGITTWTDSVNEQIFSGSAAFDADYANGHAGVYFNGTDDILGNTALSGTPDAENLSLFIVGGFSSTVNDDASDFMVSGQYPTGTSNNRLRILKGKTDGRIDARVGGGPTETDITPAVNGPHIYSIISGQTPGSWNLSIDGNLLASGTSGPTEPLQGLFLGGYGNGLNQFMDGTIAEVLLYQGALTENESLAVLDYLSRKYFRHTLDTDMDGLSDVWETGHFPGLHTSSGGLDNYDGDLQTDLEEWIAGTDATDPAAFFSIAAHKIRPDGMEITFFATPERSYTLEQTTDLNQTNGWVIAKDLGPFSSAGEQAFMLNTSTNGFFRIRATLK